MRFLIGRVMNKSLKFIFFNLILISFAIAEITLPIAGVPLNDSIDEKKEYKDIQSGGVYVPGLNNKDLEIKANKKSIYVSDDNIEGDLDKAVTLKEKLKSHGARTPHSMETGKVYQRLTNKDLLYRFQGEGSRSFSFFYIKDTYDISDSNGIYDRTFGEGVSKAKRGGTLHISFENFWIHNKVFLGYTMNFGVGLSQGRGSFTSNGVVAEQSSTTFSLWTIPVDLGLVFEIPLGNWFKIGVSGGPSVMGLYQNRNDRDNGESGKRLRQVSPGYFGRANLKISLSHFMAGQAVRNMNSYDMTKMYLTLEARTQEFSSFQDDLSVSGNSFGLGFSFEYL